MPNGCFVLWLSFGGFEAGIPNPLTELCQPQSTAYMLRDRTKVCVTPPHRISAVHNRIRSPRNTRNGTPRSVSCRSLAISWPKNSEHVRLCKAWHKSHKHKQIILSESCFVVYRFLTQSCNPKCLGEGLKMGNPQKWPAKRVHKFLWDQGPKSLSCCFAPV